MLIGLSILCHSCADTMTMLERDRKGIYGSDCSVVDNPKNRGSISRLIIERHNYFIDDMENFKET